MTQTVNNTPATLLPMSLFNVMADGAYNGYCMLDKLDGSVPIKVSSYKFMEELATNPQMQGDAWKQALDLAGVTVGAIVGYGSLIAVTGPFAPFTALAAVIAAPFFGANRMSTIIVCNKTEGTMTLHETFQDCGVQTAKPVYSEIDPGTGSTISSQADTIPGLVQIIPGLRQAGVGLWRFEKNLDWGLGFYGTGGAISWTFTSAYIKTTMAFAWLVPESGDLGCFATTDLSKYASLSDFYYKTADKRGANANRGEGAPQEPRIVFSLGARRYPDNNDTQDAVFTILVTD